MHATSLFTLTSALAGLTAAAPSPNNNLSASKGIKLRVHLIDATKDLPKPVSNLYITSIHDGAGLNSVGFSDQGRTFYINGTGSDGLFWRTLSDGGSPSSPYGLALHYNKDTPDVQGVRLDGGPGDSDIYVPAAGYDKPELIPYGWMACDEPLAYYGGTHFNILQRNAFQGAIPKECVSVKLLPECTDLPATPPGALANHDHAIVVSCYKDASKAE
ncbi:hypothetical protein VHEMI08037 [[Torrubiella] hemipterigena]|uniref:DUF7907 domain-containing protein n=1 Tax=[Torrubiella] hemipterigena TaxID=1531966 RepID=A0A0A1TNZ5_9HYPO|nr:hypothetical protein VHEMI08037 [[Torrubiella] hemipterigena]